MKAKTKKQKEIMALSGQLRPLTTAQMQWAFNNTFTHFAYRLKNGKAVCMSCGHEWTADEGMTTCPHCGRRVEVKTTAQRVCKEKSYFNVITTKGGYQVVRMFILIAEFRKGMKANPAYLEIGQYWIDPKGGKTVVGLCRTFGGYYFDCFAYGSPFEIRRDNEAFQRISDEWVYPRIKATETLKRNGFAGYCHCINPVTLFQQLLTNPKAETLMKAGEIELLRHLCHHPQEVDKYWDSIKAARRAGFKFINVQTWFDYIRMLDRMGKDLHNPNLVAPTDLQAAHNEYVAKVERQRIKEHICVGSSSYYLKKDSLVFTAKIGRKTIATIEISLKDYSVIQCRAFANGVCKYTDRISEIIKANTKLIRQRKRARA